MEVIFGRTSDFLSGFSYLLDGDYYGGLFEKYFSLGGFIVGLILVLMVYFANPQKDTHPVKGFIRVLALVAVVNSCYRLCIMLCGLTGTTYFYSRFHDDAVLQLFAADNVIAGLILTMTVSNDLRRKPRCAVLLGLTCYAILPLMRYDQLSYMGATAGAGMMELLGAYALMLAASTMILCWIMCCRRYFFTAWIWYFATHMVMRVIWFFLDNYRYVVSGGGEGLGAALAQYLGSFTVDYAVFLAALLVGIFFEKGVLTGRTRRRATR